jgi:hypothetical protein
MSLCLWLESLHVSLCSLWLESSLALYISQRILRGLTGLWFFSSSLPLLSADSPLSRVLAAGIEDTFPTSSVATEKLPTNCAAEVRCVVTVLLVRCLVNNAASDIPAFRLLGSTSQYIQYILARCPSVTACEISFISRLLGSVTHFDTYTMSDI